MQLLKKLFANVKQLSVMRGTAVVMTILGLLVIAQTHSNPFIAWLVGLLNGVLITLLWTGDDIEE